MSFIEVKHLRKEFNSGKISTLALKDVSFELDEGTFNVVLGPSGSGKTTMLNMIGGMDSPTEGSIVVNNKEISKLNEASLTEYRRKSIGFVFQFYNIIPTLSVLENVELVGNLNKNTLSAKDVLDSVGLHHRTRNFPQDLSGGELQRVSIARAICKNPDLLLCDEPTGALDSETGKQVLEALKEMSDLYNKTIIVVTHNAAIAEMADKVIKIKDGLIDEVKPNTRPKKIDEIVW